MIHSFHYRNEIALENLNLFAEKEKIFSAENRQMSPTIR